ncbi:MAG: hypothetical protein L0Z53_12010 [Acidobacteriales bacterium]|nr:hypothetical protein [Terriglobales bacterium]MCI0625410.1 hypothetical protein [Acidobacteriota bacterium]
MRPITMDRVMRCRRARRFLFVCGGVLCLAVAVVAGVAPFGTGLLELDGDVITGNQTPAGDDWLLLNGNGMGMSPGAPGGSEARRFVMDPTNATIFTTGGSKDPLDIPNWRHKSGSSPDKDEITNGYVAAYITGQGDTLTPAGELVLYFGADRFAQNGDANIGFWFFQSDVAPQGDGTFSGAHVDHDLFVVSEFTQGGGVSTITVFEWNNTNCASGPFPSNPVVGQCADNNLKVLFKQANVCGSADACAEVNSSPQAVTWPYTPKTGSAGTIPVGGFYEGGINVSQLLASVGVAQLPCFSSFVIETRSSSEPSAQLKDFVSGSLTLCGIAISKTCACTSFVPDGSGFNYSFGGAVTNSGIGTLFNVTVTDQGKVYNCGTLTTTTPKNFPADCTGPAATFFNANFPTTNQATVVANVTSDPASQTITAMTGPVNCNTQSPAGACTPNPSLTVDKTCVTTLQVLGNNVVVRVDFTGAVHNAGNVNLNSVQVTEDHNADGSLDATFSVGTLTPQGTPGADKCYTNNAPVPCPVLTPPAAGSAPIAGVASYFPNTFTPITPMGRAQFSDKVRATGINPFGNVSVASHPAGQGFTANCLICPFGFCPTMP